MNNCIFCRIIKKEVKSEIVYEDENTIAIRDIYPQAPIHILVIPKTHIPTIVEIDEKTSISIFNAIKEVSRLLNLSSFRVVNNFGPDAFQTIYHVHFHILAGRKFSWPPG